MDAKRLGARNFFVAYALLSALAVVALLFTVVPVEPAMADDVVVFPDPKLEEAIRDAINQPQGDIHQSTLLSITSLDADYHAVENLEGLQCCTNIERLDLGYNRIEDLSPLADLSSLRDLDLVQNRIGDLTPLGALVQLEDLLLEENEIVDIAPLAGLNSLKYLYLQENLIADISPLASLGSLQYLGLEENAIGSIAPLAGMHLLTSASLGDNQISDLSPLAGLQELRYLRIEGNGISDLSGLSDLPSLTHFDAHRNGISDLSPLAQLVSLEYPDVSFNQVTSLDPLASLPNLKRVYARHNSIESLAPLANNPALGLDSYVDVGGNELDAESINVHAPAMEARGVRLVYDDAPPREFPDPALRDAVYRELTDCFFGWFENEAFPGPIYQTDLDSLFLYDWPEFSANGCGIVDITGVEYLTGAERLALRDNAISDIAPLSLMPALESAYLSGNEISDVSPLASMDRLSSLDLRDNLIVDIAPLAANQALVDCYIDLRYNLLNDESVGVHVPTLVSRGNEVKYDDTGPVYVPDEALRNALLDSACTHVSDMTLWPSDLASISRLDASNLNIQDLTGLEACTGLWWLYLDDNGISDVSALGNLPNLQKVSLKRNPIASIAPLAQNPGMGFGDYDELDIREVILDQESLDVHVPALIERGVDVLYEPRPPFEVDDPVLKAHLGNPDGPVWVSQLGGGISVYNLPVESLGGLEGLVLERVSFRRTPIIDISPLETVSGLESVWLSDNLIEDIGPLVRNSSLGEGDLLHIEGNPLSDQSVNEHIPALEARGVEVWFEQGRPTIKLVPSGDSFAIGNEVSVEVRLESPVDSIGTQFEVAFDADRLRFTRFDQGSYYEDRVNPGQQVMWFGVPPTIDNNAGTASNVAVIFLPGGLGSATGDGTLAILAFVAESPGTAGVDLSRCDVVNQDQSATMVHVVPCDVLVYDPCPAWDQDHNHVCDLNDILSVAGHWRECGLPGWIPADIKPDGEIDLFDIIAVGSHWNETW